MPYVRPVEWKGKEIILVILAIYAVLLYLTTFHKYAPERPL